jgi:hypothetical protein
MLGRAAGRDQRAVTTLVAPKPKSLALSNKTGRRSSDSALASPSTALAAKPKARNLMSVLQDEFDPLAVVVDWLDACRWGGLDTLLNLYDERATLECDCECVSLTGRKAIEAYWAPKLESKAILAFSLNAMALTADGVRVDYQSDEGKSVQIDFRFGPSGKILHTSCVPSE